MAVLQVELIKAVLRAAALPSPCPHILALPRPFRWTPAARGEGDDEGEQYEVDFLRKAWMEGGAQAQARGRSASPGHGADAQPVDTMHLATASTGEWAQRRRPWHVHACTHAFVGGRWLLPWGLPGTLKPHACLHAYGAMCPPSLPPPMHARLSLLLLLRCGGLGGAGGLQSDDMRRERDRREWEVNERRRAAQEDEEEERRKRMRQVGLCVARAGGGGRWGRHKSSSTHPDLAGVARSCGAPTTLLWGAPAAST